MNILRHTFMGRLAFVALAFILGGTPLVAQQVRLSPGNRVRVQVAGESGGRIFTLKEVVADTLVLDNLNEGTQENAITRQIGFTVTGQRGIPVRRVEGTARRGLWIGKWYCGRRNHWPGFRR